MNAGKVREGDCVFKILEVSDSNVEGISDVPSNAFSLMTEPPRVKRTAELAAAAEDDASATLSRTLEVYGLLSVELQRGRVRGLKTKVPEEELTHVQKMRRESNESRSGHREQASKHQCTKCPLGRRSPEPCRHRRFLAARGRARRGRRVCEPVVNEPDAQFLNLDQMQKRSSCETQRATDKAEVKGTGPRPQGKRGSMPTREPSSLRTSRRTCSIASSAGGCTSTSSSLSSVGA
ncbi:hypothetical protein T492DRAFT_1095181 [Pavlovales sp. CCMP2436]|nr:hypothetical protein T492DRAFT_1095181 [Pavlovales sp. CCMP2436]